MAKDVVTYGDLLELLELTAKAKYAGDDKVLIKGNKKLELERARDVKALEDMLVKLFKKCDMVRGGITYIRKYEHMYPKKRKK